MNKKESDRLKAEARQVYQEQQAAKVGVAKKQYEQVSVSYDYSRYFVWGTAILLVMVFIII